VCVCVCVCVYVHACTCVYTIHPFIIDGYLGLDIVDSATINIGDG
jgi:hypothetical protein